MTTTADPVAAAECEYCGRKDGTHDPECATVAAAKSIDDAAALAGNEAPVEPVEPVEPVDGESGEPCSECGQVPDGQTGEYPCAKCGIPTTHDASAGIPIGQLVRAIEVEGGLRVAFVKINDEAVVRCELVAECTAGPNEHIYPADVAGTVEPVDGETARKVFVDGADAEMLLRKPTPVIPKLTLLEAMERVSKAAIREAQCSDEVDEAKELHKAAKGELERAWSVALDVHRRTGAAQMTLGETP